MDLGDSTWTPLFMILVGDEYGEKSKLLERDRKGGSLDLTEDPGELVFNLPTE
jgi:hypothetical protein